MNKRNGIIISSVAAVVALALVAILSFGGSYKFVKIAGDTDASAEDAATEGSNDYDDTVSYSYAYFSDIMGMSGVVQKTESPLGNETFCTRTYYAQIGSGYKEIACTTDLQHGQGVDYKVDINGDGINELICNSQSGCGHVYAQLYILQDGQVWHGYINLPQEVIDAHGWWGHEALDVAYNPDTMGFDLTYYDQSGAIIAESTYPLDKAEFNLEEYL